MPDPDENLLRNKHRKMIQELNRLMLNVEVQDYETEIQDYECAYQHELCELQQQVSNPSASDHKRQTDILIHFLEVYLKH